MHSSTVMPEEYMIENTVHIRVTMTFFSTGPTSGNCSTQASTRSAKRALTRNATTPAIAASTGTTTTMYQ